MPAVLEVSLYICLEYCNIPSVIDCCYVGIRLESKAAKQTNKQINKTPRVWRFRCSSNARIKSVRAKPLPNPLHYYLFLGPTTPLAPTSTIVSKPKEFAHLIKNRFGSADNITQLSKFYIGMYPDRPSGHLEKSTSHHYHHHHHHRNSSNTPQQHHFHHLLPISSPSTGLAVSRSELDDQGVTETDGKSGGTLPASFKYASDDENSSITSGSGPHAGGLLMGSPGHTASGGGHFTSTQAGQQLQMVTLTPGALEPIMAELKEVKESNRRVSEVLLRQTEEFEDHRVHMQNEMSLLRSQLEDERFRVERLEEQLNDLTELHQHEILNLRQDLASTEEKIEYRLDERTTDLSDLVDNTSTRISRLEQQQQQQQILSMEMVENATFRTIISKLINVVLALLAVVLVCVSTAANFLSPFLHSTPRLVISLTAALLAWLVYHYLPNIQAAGSWTLGIFSWPWS
ncbi:transmembrane and coiled-coil domains protein [Plakobranchus ocellatus]|uniref:Transmembrane and coiled-coil domains protein n=1 Tax=Plakobranchus ocellatus TaxID=259542 RepID=A0AAV4A0X8_9GAST|nr:transmembrane and coiled-coil domains protein [Plakobranchus ocellatus]